MVAREPHMSPSLDPKRAPDPSAFVDSFGAFALDGTEALLRPAEAAPEEVRRFSTFSMPERIRSICLNKVPGWSVFSGTDIVVDQLMEGLTNQIFKVHLVVPDPSAVPCVLFRIYGKDCAALIDQKAEIETFKTLSSYQIAPKMYAHDIGWRIEEWHSAVALKTKYMRNPAILTQVASALGRLHKLPYREDFPRNLRMCPPASLRRMQDWGKCCEEAASKMTECSESMHALEQLNLKEMLSEQVWLRGFCVADDPHIRGSGLDVVFSHCDLQENNILQTQYGLRFIDFEYSAMDYQSVDIANYFCECMVDYVSQDSYPFYSVSLSDYPTEWEQRLFCSIYLSEYLETSITLEDLAVTRLLARVRRFTLVSHYQWAVWSVARAPAGMTFNEFDFLHYSQARWDAYKRVKTEILLGEEHPHPPLRTPTHSFADLRDLGQSEVNSSPPVPDRPRKTPYVLGGALTGGGVLVGVMAVVLAIQMLKA